MIISAELQRPRSSYKERNEESKTKLKKKNIHFISLFFASNAWLNGLRTKNNLTFIQQSTAITHQYKEKRHKNYKILCVWFSFSHLLASTLFASNERFKNNKNQWASFWLAISGNQIASVFCICAYFCYASYWCGRCAVQSRSLHTRLLVHFSNQ